MTWGQRVGVGWLVFWGCCVPGMGFAMSETEQRLLQQWVIGLDALAPLLVQASAAQTSSLHPFAYARLAHDLAQVRQGVTDALVHTRWRARPLAPIAGDYLNPVSKGDIDG